VLVEVRFTGTQHADWPGIPNTGRSFDTRFAVVFDFEGDQILRCGVAEVWARVILGPTNGPCPPVSGPRGRGRS
jgi:hypothetical protein